MAIISKPCDCITMIDGFWQLSCYCQNATDLAGAASWCSDQNNSGSYACERALKVLIGGYVEPTSEEARQEVEEVIELCKKALRWK